MPHDNDFHFKTMAINLEDAYYWMSKAATLNALELSTSSQWVSGSGFSDWAMWLAGLNPVKGVYNLLRHGQYSSEVSGAFEVKTDQRRYLALRSELLGDFEKAFFRESERGPQALHAFLLRRKEGAIRSWENVQERFELARDVNNGINRELNQAIDNAYRIRVGASVAICILGSLPAAGLGAAGIAVGTGWKATALVSGGYALATEMIWNPAELHKAHIVGYHLGEGAKAGATAATSTGAQAATEYAFKRAAQRNMHSAAQRYMAAATNPRATEMLRAGRLARSNAATAGYQQTSRRVSGVVGGAAVLVGLYMMKDEVKTAFAGVTSGLDQTR